MNGKVKVLSMIALLVIAMGLSGCIGNEEHPDVDREDKIPTDITKWGPEADLHPPILHSHEFEEPVPLPYPVNTAGAEDSPFILPDGNTLYFFFTPDVRIPPEEQVTDDISGIWVTHKTSNTWSKPERVWLQEPGKLALDGAVAIQDDEMWFCSARGDYTDMNMFTARWDGESWTDWTYAGDQLMKEFEIGEVHIHGDDLYFHSDRAGGEGGRDIWMTTRSNDGWSEPINIEAVNTEENESLPFVSSDGKEVWFTRTHLGTPAIFRSLKINGDWQEPEMIVSQFAGEPTLDDAGNLYFVHHFHEHSEMIEADIYVAYKK
ncbi:MAG: hypothetical protein R6U17_01240 [Thermoplasmata archaeon]